MLTQLIKDISEGMMLKKLVNNVLDLVKNADEFRVNTDEPLDRIQRGDPEEVLEDLEESAAEDYRESTSIHVDFPLQTDSMVIMLSESLKRNFFDKDSTIFRKSFSLFLGSEDKEPLLTRQTSSKLGTHFIWLDNNAFLISKHLWISDILPLLEFAVHSIRNDSRSDQRLSRDIKITAVRTAHKPLHEENLRQRPVGDGVEHQSDANTDTVIELKGKLKSDDDEENDTNGKPRDEEGGSIEVEDEDPVGDNNPFFTPDGTLDGYAMYGEQRSIYSTVTDSVAFGLLEGFSSAADQNKNINDYYLIVRANSYSYDRIRKRYDTSRCGMTAFPHRIDEDLNVTFRGVLTGTICAYIKSLFSIAFKSEKPEDCAFQIEELEAPEPGDEYVVVDGLFSWMLFEENEKKIVHIK